MRCRRKRRKRRRRRRRSRRRRSSDEYCWVGMREESLLGYGSKES